MLLWKGTKVNKMDRDIHMYVHVTSGVECEQSNVHIVTTIILFLKQKWTTYGTQNLKILMSIYFKQQII